MFVADRNGDLVGHSVWPWDSTYTPVVGCYREGRCVAFAPCDLLRQPVDLDGPDQRWWFRMPVDPSIRAAFEDRDPAVRLVRMEDGCEIRFAGIAGQEDRSAQATHRLEQFLSRSARRDVRLDGFPMLLAEPYEFRVDILFLDILGRRADPSGLAHYTREMEEGRSLFQVRRVLMTSEEFTNRGITISDRVGALLTSPLWHLLARAEVPGRRRVPVRRIRVSDYGDLSDHDFAIRIHRDVHGDEPTEAARNGLIDVAKRHGRMRVASGLVRDAANGGHFLQLSEA